MGRRTHLIDRLGNTGVGITVVDALDARCTQVDRMELTQEHQATGVEVRRAKTSERGCAGDLLATHGCALETLAAREGCAVTYARPTTGDPLTAEDLHHQRVADLALIELVRAHDEAQRRRG